MYDGFNVSPRKSTVPIQGGAEDSARRSPCIFMATPPDAVQPELTGCASAAVNASQSSARAVAPSTDKFQSSGQRSEPFTCGESEPRTTKAFFGVAAASAVPLPPPAGTARNATSVGERSIFPRDTPACISPIRSGADSDAPVTVPPELEIAPACSSIGQPLNFRSRPS